MNITAERLLATPALIASYRIGDYPAAGLRKYPWEMTNTQALLLNAFDLLGNRRTRIFAQEIQRCQGKIHEYVNFTGPIILDSGAFNFMQHQEIAITALDVLDSGLSTDADILVVLDHPFPSTASPEEVNSRLARTQANTKTMVEALASRNGKVRNSFRLMPVLHGHDIETLERSLDSIITVVGEQPEIIGIGSLAPLAKNGNTRKAVDIILHARRMLPNSHIHVFSMGSALLMLFAFYCGANTVDSQTWIMTAAFKQVQLPGFHQTRLSKSERQKNPTAYQQTRHAFAGHLLHLVHEEGFSPRNWDSGEIWTISNDSNALAYLDYLEDEDGINHIHRRACHNLYSYNFEAERMRQIMSSGDIEDFIYKRMKSTTYRNAFEYAVNRHMAVR